jgi:hypothetical protein
MVTNRQKRIVDAVLENRFDPGLLEQLDEVASGRRTNKELGRSQPLLLTCSAAARALGIGRSTFWLWRQKGLVELVEIGGGKFVRARDLQALIDTAKPASP